MHRSFALGAILVAIVGFLGCQSETTTTTTTATENSPGVGSKPETAPTDDALTAAELEQIEKLPIEDRKLAIEQRICPVGEGHLGDPDMGPPVKMMVKGTPVFICCEGCRGKVEKDPDGILIKVAASKLDKK